jgi:hypothetical protein
MRHPSRSRSGLEGEATPPPARRYQTAFRLDSALRVFAVDAEARRSHSSSGTGWQTEPGQTSAITPLMTSHRPITPAPIVATVRPLRAIQALNRSTLAFVLSGENT